MKENKNKKKIYDTITNIIQINLNFGVTDIKTDKLILENRFGNAEGHIIKNLVSYDVFVDNIKKFCYDNNEVDKYKYILMLNKTREELEDFYPSDEIIKEYGDALMKYGYDGFIYPYTHEEEQKMIHNTEKQLAYDEGAEQKEIEMIKNLKDKLSIEEIAEVANLSIEKVNEILKEK